MDLTGARLRAQPIFWMAKNKKGSALRFPLSIYKAQGGLRQAPVRDAASPACRHGRTPE
jgi:hypothetical protein